MIKTQEKLSKAEISMEFEGEEESRHLKEKNQRRKREIVLGEKEVAEQVLKTVLSINSG